MYILLIPLAFHINQPRALLGIRENSLHNYVYYLKIDFPSSAVTSFLVGGGVCLNNLYILGVIVIRIRNIKYHYYSQLFLGSQVLR